MQQIIKDEDEKLVLAVSVDDFKQDARLKSGTVKLIDELGIIGDEIHFLIFEEITKSFTRKTELKLFNSGFASEDFFCKNSCHCAQQSHVCLEDT